MLLEFAEIDDRIRLCQIGSVRKLFCHNSLRKNNIRYGKVIIQLSPLLLGLPKTANIINYFQIG